MGFFYSLNVPVERQRAGHDVYSARPCQTIGRAWTRARANLKPVRSNGLLGALCLDRIYLLFDRKICEEKSVKSAIQRSYSDFTVLCTQKRPGFFG